MSEQKSNRGRIRRICSQCGRPNYTEGDPCDRCSDLFQPPGAEAEAPERLWLLRNADGSLDDCWQMSTIADSTDIEYTRVDPASSITEKAREIALKLKRDADDMFAMPVPDEPIVTQWTEIIAAEFQK